MGHPANVGRSLDLSRTIRDPASTVQPIGFEEEGAVARFQNTYRKLRGRDKERNFAFGYLQGWLCAGAVPFSRRVTAAPFFLQCRLLGNRLACAVDHKEGERSGRWPAVAYR